MRNVSYYKHLSQLQQILGEINLSIITFDINDLVLN